MKQRRRLGAVATAGVLASLIVMSLSAPVAADETEPSIISQAWYWESQQNQSTTTPVGEVVVEAPNPFCPSVPGQLGAPPEGCAEGRLPVEVQNGDYETPDKVSAVAFDLSSVPPGSTILSFTATLLEAEAGCYGKESAETDQQCEQTDSVNAEDKEVQACTVTQIFGDGEARIYKEVPNHTCEKTDAVATRKEIKNDDKTDPTDTDVDYVWTFDLTTLAADALDRNDSVASILLRPKAPKEAGSGPQESWRVVFAGPKFAMGVVTNLEFEPPAETDTTDPGTDPVDTGTDLGSGTTGSIDTGSSSDFGSSSDLGSSDSSGGDTAAPDTPGTEAPLDIAGESAADETALPTVQNFPGYVWLALLAGLMGFSLVRSIVLEQAAGHRANGVLAQIHRLNAEKRGASVAGEGAPATGPGLLLAKGLETVKSSGNKIVGLTRKIPGLGRKG